MKDTMIRKAVSIVLTLTMVFSSCAAALADGTNTTRNEPVNAFNEEIEVDANLDIEGKDFAVRADSSQGPAPEQEVVDASATIHGTVTIESEGHVEGAAAHASDEGNATTIVDGDILVSVSPCERGGPENMEATPGPSRRLLPFFLRWG